MAAAEVVRREPWRPAARGWSPSTRMVIAVASGVTIAGAAVVVWDVHPVITTLATLIIGTAVTWLVAHLYYARASQDLEVRAHHLEQASVLILLALERAGHASLVRDDDGNIVDVAIELRGEARATSSATATLAMVDPEPASATSVPWWRFWERRQEEDRSHAR